MRTVAVAFAVLSIAALIPPSVHAVNNDCVAPNANNLTSSFCVEITQTQKPTGQIPDTPYWGKYYLWIGPGPCTSAPGGSACRGIPASPGSGVPLPAGAGAVGAGAFGILWQETNGVSGLQREAFFLGSLKPADHMVLV